MNLKRRMDRSKNRKRCKESAKFLSSFDGKLRSTGSFAEWNEEEESEVPGSAVVVVSFLRGKAPFRPTLLIDFDSDLGNARLKCPRFLKYKKRSTLFFTAERSKFEAVVG
jgi:hypothetical protein